MGGDVLLKIGKLLLGRAPGDQKQTRVLVGRLPAAAAAGFLGAGRRFPGLLGGAGRAGRLLGLFGCRLGGTPAAPGRLGRSLGAGLLVGGGLRLAAAGLARGLLGRGFLARGLSGRGGLRGGGQPG